MANLGRCAEIVRDQGSRGYELTQVPTRVESRTNRPLSRASRSGLLNRELRRFGAKDCPNVAHRVRFNRIVLAERALHFICSVQRSQETVLRKFVRGESFGKAPTICESTRAANFQQIVALETKFNGHPWGLNRLGRWISEDAEKISASWGIDLRPFTRLTGSTKRLVPVPIAFHVDHLAPEVFLSRQCVVRPTPQRDVLHRMLAAKSERLHMMQLEEV